MRSRERSAPSADPRHEETFRPTAASRRRPRGRPRRPKARSHGSPEPRRRAPAGKGIPPPRHERAAGPAPERAAGNRDASSLDAQLVHPPPESAPAHAERLGGAIPVPAVRRERLDDPLALGVRSELVGAAGCRPRPRRGAERGASALAKLRREILDLDRLPGAERDRVFERVLELADVAGPGVASRGRSVCRARGEAPGPRGRRCARGDAGR